jgi:O-antigen/teichoic acid export membrane protein
MSEAAVGPTAVHGVAAKTVRGAFALGIRQVFIQGIGFLCGIILARLLTPSQFGIYAIVLYFQNFLISFGDAGLAASLVRQHDDPGVAEYRAIFTVQQIVVLIVSVLLWLAAPLIASKYHLQSNDAWLFRLVGLSFVVTSFITVPFVRLDRRLAFHKIAVVESTQALAFNVVAVFFAWRGYGAYAFAWALLLRSCVGAALANWISPWPIGWHWNWQLVRAHLSFGIPYQGIAITSLLKDSISPIFIGLLLGTAKVGYISWAIMLAAYPAQVLFILQRLYMPAFARLQNDRLRLSSLVENIMWATNAIAAPLSVLTLAMVVPITTVVYGPKWLVALPFFYLFWGANLFVPSATPALGLLNALGKSRIALLFAAIWMAATWLIGAPLILLYGAIGFAIGNLAVMFSALWLYRAAQRQVPFRLYSVIAPVWAIAAASGIVVYILYRLRAPSHIVTIGAYGTCGLLLYGLGIYRFHTKRIHAVWSALKGAA